jgi:hypothetical protein
MERKYGSENVSAVYVDDMPSYFSGVEEPLYFFLSHPHGRKTTVRDSPPGKCILLPVRKFNTTHNIVVILLIY